MRILLTSLVIAAALTVACDRLPGGAAETPVPQVHLPLSIAPAASSGTSSTAPSRANAAAFLATPPPFVLPAPTGGAPPSIVREVVEAARRGDEARFQALLRTRAVPCSPPNTMGWRVCAPGESVGTPVETFTIVQGCNAFDVDPATARRQTTGLLGSGVRAFAAAPEALPAPAGRVGARYLVVLTGATRDNGVLGLFLDDVGIIQLTIGCTNAESLVRRLGDTLGPLYDLGP